MSTENDYEKDKAKLFSQVTITSNDEFMVWDDLFSILAWKFKATKSGDMYLDSEAVYNELKEKFNLQIK